MSHRIVDLLSSVAEQFPFFMMTDGNGGKKVNKIRIGEAVLIIFIVVGGNYMAIEKIGLKFDAFTALMNTKFESMTKEIKGVEKSAARNEKDIRELRGK